MKRILFALVSLILSAVASAAQAAPQVGQGAFSQYVDKETRPKLGWETLKGYRLFFHPDDSEANRRALTIAVPVYRKIISAWAMVRPISTEGQYADAWLRVEGEPTPEKVSISWDGAYRGRPFPDGPYRFEVHLKYQDGDEQSWDVLVLKSRDYPSFVKFNGQPVFDHALAFKNGEFRPVAVAAEVSRAQGSVAMLARVLAPDLAEPFNTEGLQVQGRMVEDLQGKPVAGPWECLCTQPLPDDSPARKLAKKVRCDWDLGTAAPGVWELRLGLYHPLKHRVTPEPCDEPILDEDRLRVRVLP
jgi:hypothetical protein